MNIIITSLIAVATFVGGAFMNAPANYNKLSLYDAGADNHIFGSISFPTSLDALTNPGATDSVATVSHSAQHSDANDAVEALEAKLGIGASAPFAGSLLQSTTTGTSLWRDVFSIKGGTFSSMATTSNFLATGSSTLQNFTAQNFIGANATTTQATTTNLYVSTFASTTAFRANSEVIGDSTIGNLTVTSCTGCSTTQAGSWYIATTTSNRYMAKTLDLVAGDIVIFSADNSAGFGTLSYRISSPWSVATTTIASGGTPVVHHSSFMATTTETVTFEYTPDSGGALASFTVFTVGAGYGARF